jgi:stress-induced morphogen
MSDQVLKKKIRDVLKGGYFADVNDLVDVSDGSVDNIHLVIVSRKFDGRRSREKSDLIWSELTKLLSPDEWGKISLSVGVSPEEVKSA